MAAPDFDILSAILLTGVATRFEAGGPPVLHDIA